MEEQKVRCPYCGSTEITAQKKGFSAGKAVAGGLLAGPVGLAAGGIGSGKVKCTCLRCGRTWNAGENPKTNASDQICAAVFALVLFLIYLFIKWIISLF